MRQPDLISRSRADKKQPHRARGFVSSILIHGILLCGLAEVSILLHSQMPLATRGAEPGSRIISLQLVLVISPPARPVPPSPALRSAPEMANVLEPRTPASAPHPALRPMLPEPVILPHPEIGLPVLAGKVTRPLPAMPAETGAPIHQAAAVASSGGGIGHLRPTDEKYSSSYAPGVFALPHPPYPPEALDLQQTGIVRMLVHFDEAGKVARAEVAGSSGVAILDAETCAFIRANWHSLAFAGQAVRVPVEYRLTSL